MRRKLVRPPVKLFIGTASVVANVRHGPTGAPIRVGALMRVGPIRERWGPTGPLSLGRLRTVEADALQCNVDLFERLLAEVGDAQQVLSRTMQ